MRKAAETSTALVLQKPLFLSKFLFSAGDWKPPLAGNLMAQCNLQLWVNESWCTPKTEITLEHKAVTPGSLKSLVLGGFAAQGLTWACAAHGNSHQTPGRGRARGRAAKTPTQCSLGSCEPLTTLTVCNRDTFCADITPLL